MSFKKGKKVCIIRMDDQGLLTVVRATVTQVDQRGTVYVRRPLTVDGKQDLVVVDCKPGEVYENEKSAALVASNRIYAIIQRQLERLMAMTNLSR